MPQHDEPVIAAEASGDGGLLVKLAGAWSIQGPLPATDELTARLKAVPADASLRFDFSQLGTYDSSLISLLVELAKQCERSRIELDSSGVPERVLALLKMSLAGPERKTHQAPEKDLFFTRLGRAGLTLGADVLELFTFVGVSTISFGQFLRGKAIFRISDTWLIIQRVEAVNFRTNKYDNYEW